MIYISRERNSKKDIITKSSSFLNFLYNTFIGRLFLKLIPLNPDLIVFIVLTFVGIEMIVESLKKEEVIKKTSLIELLFFGLAVSIDSFSVGIGLNTISNNYLLCSCIFSLASFLFTYLGLKLGYKINQIVGKVSTIIGGIVLIILGMIYLL